jgi:hypothetical protein
MRIAEMTDAEVKEQIERADRFTEALRHVISEAVAAVDPSSPCANEASAGLAKIEATLDQAPFVVFCNLANLDAAIKRTGTGLMPLNELRLMATGAGPSLDFKNATELLAPLANIVEQVRRRKIN